MAKAGLIWVGPPPAAIRAMGLKDAAKKLMDKAGVPTTPGYLGDDQAEKTLAQGGGEDRLPGADQGGGRRRRQGHAARWTTPADLPTRWRRAKREAKAAFGDDRVLLEKYVTQPRHIEVQVFADSHGNVVHLFERDCSLQRRHQKVIEEAPAPGMDETTRAAVTGAAVKAAKAVGYVGAGTVEFIADASEGLKPDRIWFMEMNTRLQVEHPVTEAITGLDLVEWQLRVAAAKSCRWRRKRSSAAATPSRRGCMRRIPLNGFLPSTGTLTHLRLPRRRARRYPASRRAARFRRSTIR